MAGSADSDTQRDQKQPSSRGEEESSSKNPLKEARESIGDSETPADAPAKIVKGAMPVEADWHHARPDKPDQTYSGAKFQERAPRPISQGRPGELQAALQGEHDPKTSLSPRK